MSLIHDITVDLSIALSYGRQSKYSNVQSAQLWCKSRVHEWWCWCQLYTRNITTAHGINILDPAQDLLRWGWLITEVDKLCAIAQSEMIDCTDVPSIQNDLTSLLCTVMVDSIEGDWEVEDFEGKIALIDGINNVIKDFEQCWLSRSTTPVSWLNLLGRRLFLGKLINSFSYDDEWYARVILKRKVNLKSVNSSYY